MKNLTYWNAADNFVFFGIQINGDIMGYNSDDIKVMAENYAKAWCSLSPEAVASFYAPDGQIAINKGDAIKGRDAIKEMVSGFYAEFPDLAVLCDEVRTSADHAIFIWTLKGHHSETKIMSKLAVGKNGNWMKI